MKALDLFSGIGGISLAAEWAGIETVAFCEIEPFCQKVLQKHWPDVPIFDDVRKLSRQALEERGVDVGSIELVFGGYPCQPFSVAGKRQGERDNRHLWPEVYRLLKEIRPTWFLGENVAGHVTLGLDQVLSDLEDINYSSQTFIIPACGVNAPHRRNIVFIVAHANSRKSRPTNEPEPGKSALSEFGAIRTNQSGNVAHANSKRCEKFNAPARCGKTGSATRGTYSGWIQWAVEPSVGRVASGVSRRVDRLRALGNAVVPQQIYPVLKAIIEANEVGK